MTRLDPQFRERSFGISVGGVLIALGVLLLWRGRSVSGAAGLGIGLLLMTAGRLRPALLARPAAAWWRMAGVLGAINARIVLTLAFALILTPIGLIWRATGRDPLARRRPGWIGWTARPRRFASPDHYRRMY